MWSGGRREAACSWRDAFMHDELATCSLCKVSEDHVLSVPPYTIDFVKIGSDQNRIYSTRVITTSEAVMSGNLGGV